MTNVAKLTRLQMSEGLKLEAVWELSTRGQTCLRRNVRHRDCCDQLTETDVKD